MELVSLFEDAASEFKKGLAKVEALLYSPQTESKVLSVLRSVLATEIQNVLTGHAVSLAALANNVLHAVEDQIDGNTTGTVPMITPASPAK